MKNIRTLVAFLVAFLITQISFGQDIFRILEKEHPNATLGEIIKVADAYFAKKGNDDHENEKEENENGEGEYYLYKRWEHELKQRFALNQVPTNYLESNFEEFHRYIKRQNRLNTQNRTTSNNGNWRLYGPTTLRVNPLFQEGVGRVNVIVADPDNANILYLGAPNGGVWRSTDNGNSWTPLMDGMPILGVSGIVIDRTSPIGNRSIYLLTGDGDGTSVGLGPRSKGVLVSTNNGNTWLSTGAFQPTGQPFSGYKLIQNSGNNNLLAATSLGVQLSTNGGLSWSNTQSGYFVDIELHPTNPQIVYASTIDGEFFRSTNGGIAWMQIISGLPASSYLNRLAIAVTENIPDRVYLLFGMNRKIYRSDDAGQTFSFTAETPSLGQPWYDLAITSSPTSGNIVHIGGVYNYKSVDGGNTWNSSGTEVHNDYHEFIYIGNVLYCGTDGGIYRSLNDGGNYSFIGKGVAITQFYKIGGDPNLSNIVLGGAQDNGVNMVYNDTMCRYSPGDGTEAFIDPNPQGLNNTRILFGSSQNGGLTRTEWTNNSIGPAIGMKPSAVNYDDIPFVIPFCMDPNDQNKLYACYKDIFRYDVQAKSWTNISNGNVGYWNLLEIAVAPSNSNIIYTSHGFDFYVTLNAGTTWTKLNNPPATNNFIIHPQDPQKIWVAGFGKVYYSANGGQTWTDISGTLPNLAAKALIYQKNSKNRLYLGMDVGVYYIDDDHSDWQLFTNGLPCTTITDFDINYNSNLLRAGTFGRGIWETELICDAPTTSTVTGLIGGTQFYSGTALTSTNTTIGSNSNVNFKAENYVQFNEFFEVKSTDNIVFRAYLNEDLCAPAAPAAPIPVTGTYAGPMPGLASLVSPVVEKITNAGDFDLFPNPAKDITNLEFITDKTTQVEISIHNLHGIQVGDKVTASNLRPGKYEFNLNTGSLSSGTYFVLLTRNGETVKKKLVVIK